MDKTRKRERLQHNFKEENNWGYEKRGGPAISSNQIRKRFTSVRPSWTPAVRRWSSWAGCHWRCRARQGPSLAVTRDSCKPDLNPRLSHISYFQIQDIWTWNNKKNQNYRQMHPRLLHTGSPRQNSPHWTWILNLPRVKILNVKWETEMKQSAVNADKFILFLHTFLETFISSCEKINDQSWTCVNIVSLDREYACIWMW